MTETLKLDEFPPHMQEAIKVGMMTPLQQEEFQKQKHQDEHGRVLDLVLFPEDSLRETCVPVAEVTDEIRKLVNDMQMTMCFHHGAGLAAPQVGHRARVVITRVEQHQDPEDDSVVVFINPVIVDRSGETSSMEGCLSIPGASGRVGRSEKITVKCLNLDGQEHTVMAEGWGAIVLQHEIDHLNGILFLDHLGKLSKDKALKRNRKEMRRLWRAAKRASK
jgi:peptide deformylase